MSNPMTSQPSRLASSKGVPPPMNGSAILHSRQSICLIECFGKRAFSRTRTAAGLGTACRVVGQTTYAPQ